ncbi:MAG: cellulose-binding protein [Dactylosporangium sp.]|nr:cellulose-binding protein [Dactylosporangium sp.]NNJ59969.1 cellulose-binding protein [Dactylosporangium sp.]
MTGSGRSLLRRSMVVLSLAALTVAGSVMVNTAAGAAVPLAAGVEDDGADCAVTLPSSTPSNAMLPDPFTKINGTRVTTKADWRCRREEIKKLAEKTIYGEKPTNATVTGTVTSSRITANVTANGRTVTISASVSLPSGTGPFPGVFVVGGFGDTNTIKAAGAAIINYDPLAVGKEGTSRSNKQGAFYTLYGSTSTTGLLAAWAWGVSRLIDVIAQSDGRVLIADRSGVTGCSRYGKAAFAIGVFDQRIALTIPVESGSGGVSAFRAIARDGGAQPLSSTYNEQPWLGDAFGGYVNNPNGLPVDTHEMVGMVAPRGLLILDNPAIAWLGARNAAIAATAGMEVYKALGASSALTYTSTTSNGNHCAIRSEWNAPTTNNVKKFLVGTGTGATGGISVSGGAPDMSSWKNWTTPTLG